VIQQLIVSDFRAVRGTVTHEFPEGVSVLVGANEVGKTSRLLAIAFALYGPRAMPDNVLAADLINDHAKECAAEVWFTHSGATWRVRRALKRDGRTHSEMYRLGPDDDRPEQHAIGAAPVTEAVTRLLGVDAAGFTLSVFARQKELDALASKDPRDRVAAMLRFVGIDQADAAVKAIRKQRNEKRQRLEVVRAGLPDVEALKEAEYQHDQALTNAEAELVQAEGHLVLAEGELRVLNDQWDGLMHTRDRYTAWEASLAELQSQRRTAEALISSSRNRIQVVPTDHEAPVPEPVPEVALDYADEDARNATRAALMTAQRDLAALMEERASVTDTCPTCGRAFDNADEAREHQQRLDKRIEELQASIPVLSQEMLQHDQRRADHIEQKRRADEIQRKNERAQQQWEQSVALLKQRREANEQAQQEIDAQAKVLAHCEMQIEAHNKLEPVYDAEQAFDLDQALSAKADEIAGLRERIATLRGDVRTHSALREQVQAQLAAAAGKRDEANAIEREALTLDSTASEMGAMRDSLVASIIPTLEARASALVDELTDGKHSQLRLSDSYEIQYVTETGALRSFASLSGGAQSVFALSLRLAIAELRGGFDFLILDEVFDALDGERQALAWGVIERLAKRYATVLVVTHVDALRERAPSLIAV